MSEGKLQPELYLARRESGSEPAKVSVVRPAEVRIPVTVGEPREIIKAQVDVKPVEVCVVESVTGQRYLRGFAARAVSFGCVWQLLHFARHLASYEKNRAEGDRL